MPNENAWKTIGIWILVILAFVGISSIINGANSIKSPSETSRPQSTTVIPKIRTSDCYLTGSNVRAALCLQEAWNERKKIMGSMPQFEGLYQLALKDAKMTGNSYYEANPTFEATLVNNSSRTAKNVGVKFKIWQGNKQGTCNDSSDDTQYVLVSDIISPGDSQRIKTIVQTNVDTSGSFRWCAEVGFANEYYSE